jgi:hypothetical protein
MWSASSTASWRVVEEAVGLTRVEEREDVRVLQIRRGLDLGHEALASDDRRQLGLQNLERHLSVVLQVLGHVDRGHPALADRLYDAVAVFQGLLQAVERIGHGNPA